MVLMLSDVKVHAIAVAETLHALLLRTEVITRKVHKVKLYAARSTQLFIHGAMIVNELDCLIQGLMWLKTGVLSPLLVLTATLETIIAYVDSHLEHNAAMKVNIIPSTLADFHKMISFFMTKVMGKLIITMNILLTSYNGPFKVFEMKAVPIRVPNSELDSLLEVPYRYVAIHEVSGALIALSANDAKKVLQSVLSHLVFGGQSRNKQIMHDCHLQE